MPAAAYVCMAVHEPLPSPAAGRLASAGPSSHEKLQVCVSRLPGSVKFAVRLVELPRAIGPIGPVTLFMTGATLLIVIVAMYSVKPPSLSITLPFTVRTPLSVVEQLTILLGVNA